MSGRYPELVQRLREAVLGGKGATQPALRRVVEAHAAGVSGRPAAPDPVPAALAPFVDRVARHAYTVAPADIAALRRAGYSEDAIFEITASAALGAGLGRLERGLAALSGQV